MFCPKCGKENDKKSKFCSSCGAEIKQGDLKEVQNTVNVVNSNDFDSEAKEPKVNSILSLVFGILLAPIGLIISIVGMIRSSKYKKKSGKSSSYIGLNIAGLVISIIGTLLTGFLVLLFGGLYILFSSQDELLEGTWNCSYNSLSSSYITEVEFDDGQVIWAKYGDKENNNYIGTYKIKSREYKNGKNVYEMTFNLKTKTLDGVISSNINDVNMEITFNDHSATIKSDTSKPYYCSKAD